jgi:hypothetical protein
MRSGVDVSADGSLTIDQCAQPTLAGNAVMVRRAFSQKIQMMLAPRDDIVEIVARHDVRAAQQKKNFC